MYVLILTVDNADTNLSGAYVEFLLAQIERDLDKYLSKYLDDTHDPRAHSILVRNLDDVSGGWTRLAEDVFGDV